MRMDKIIIDQTGIKQQVINEICELAQKYNVEQVLLFGSRSRGDYKRTSDIDLAVRGGDIDRFALDVEEETTTLLEYDIVDLDEPKKIRQTQKCNAGFFYLLYYYEICITDILSPNFLSNLLNKSHLLPLIIIS